MEVRNPTLRNPAAGKVLTNHELRETGLAGRVRNLEWFRPDATTHHRDKCLASDRILVDTVLSKCSCDRKQANSGRWIAPLFAHPTEVAVQPVEDFLVNVLRARWQVATFEHGMTLVG